MELLEDYREIVFGVADANPWIERFQQMCWNFLNWKISYLEPAAETTRLFRRDDGAIYLMTI